MVFRADASIQIGAGHVMRCLSLATELRSRGAECQFVCRSHPGNLIEKIKSLGFSVFELPLGSAQVSDGDLGHSEWLGVSQSLDAKQTSEAIKDVSTDWIVVDHYGLDFRWESTFHGRGIRILAIDDLADRRHQCDLFLDQTFGRSEGDYQKYLPNSAVTLIGSKYALLRPEFKALRETALAARASRPASHILVNLGGVDKDNYTGMILRALMPESSLRRWHFTVVLGTHSPWIEDVNSVCKQIGSSVTVVVGSNEMAKLMSKADLAIGAAGSSSWERCALGLPTIQVVIAQNQRLIADRLAQAGAIKLLENVADAGALINSAPTWASKVSQICRTIADGYGAARVSDQMQARQ